MLREVPVAEAPSRRPLVGRDGYAEPASEIDLRALGAAIKRRRRAIIVPTIIAVVLMALYVEVASPRYTAQSQILLENQETFFTRPDRVNLPPDQASQVDQEAVASQVLLIGSRELARRAIRERGLTGDPEFGPMASMSARGRVLVLLGLARDPSPERVAARMTTAFGDRLTVYSPPKTRVIAVEFTSRDADLAARGANLIADLYLREQSAAKRATARQAADALQSQINDLRIKLADADEKREAYRSRSGLLAGGNNMTVSGQQLADINTDLSKARTTQADARAKASIIRDLLREGHATDVSDVVNDASVRRIADQRVLAQAQLAEAGRTLLPAHPRMKELAGQVAQYDLALKAAAKQAAATLENDARIAGQRVANLEAVLSTSKQAVGLANIDEVRLRALERNAQSLKDQLESSTTKYQEALARQSSAATPADARIIARAAVPQEPSYPKKVPFIAFATVATFVFALSFVIAGELLSGTVAVPGDQVPGGYELARAKVPVNASEDPKASGLAAEPGPARADRLHRTVSAASEQGDGEHADDGNPIADPDTTVASEPIARRGSIPGVDALGAMIASGLAYLRVFGRSAAASRPADGAGTEPVADHGAKAEGSAGMSATASVDPGSSAPVAVTSADELASLVEQIVAAHRPGHGLQIVGTSLGDQADANLTDLCRKLSGRGRSIVVDLNRAPARLATMVAAEAGGRSTIMTMPGLAELLAGTSSFAEVIHRDHASRLHFIPTGMRDADFRDFDLVLDALAETYDFIMLLAPAVPGSEIAKVMAPYADVVVLAGETETDEAVLAALKDELIEAGARDVLLAGCSSTNRGRVREVA